MPAVRPDTVSGLDAPLAVKEPGLDKAVYDVAEPTGVKATLTVVPVPPSVAVPMVGACG